MSTVYVCKGGKLMPRDPEKSTQNKPKVISYTHMIRHLPQVQCNCKEEKQRLINEYESQLTQKDYEIAILIQRIAQKESQIDKLEEQLSYFKNPQNTPATTKYQQHNNNNVNEDINWGEMNKSLNSTVVSSFSLSEWNQTSQKIRNQEMKTEKEMDDCFKKTSTLMSEIDNIMKKKRKYEFHNPILVENSIIEELQMSQQKSQQDTQEIQMQDTFCIQQYSQYNDDFDSLDMTTFQSVQNFGDASENDGQFYTKLLRDSILLKNTILQMRQESQEQMNQLEAYYQKQLKISYDQLQREKQKNSLFQITKDKLQEMSLKGRQALAELDQNQNDDGLSFYSNQNISNNGNKPIYSISNRLSPQRENIQNSLRV